MRDLKKDQNNYNQIKCYIILVTIFENLIIVIINNKMYGNQPASGYQYQALPNQNPYGAPPPVYYAPPQP